MSAAVPLPLARKSFALYTCNFHAAKTLLTSLWGGVVYAGTVHTQQAGTKNDAADGVQSAASFHAAVFFEDVGLNERLKKWHEQEKLRLSDKEENWEKDYLSWKA